VTDASLVILAGAFIGGLVSGLTGFGTGLVTLPIWLQVVSPLLASPLVVLCSIVGQVQTLPAIWHAIDWRRLAPFVAGGVVGVPLGAWALPHIRVGDFKVGVGVLLVVVCGFLLASGGQFRITRGGRAADAFIGLCSGILGGLAGLSGPLLTLWASFRGWGKDERRAVFQGFNLTILSLALVAQAVAGYLTAQVWWLLLAALPGTIVGAWIGRRIYSRLNVAAFHRVVLSLLLVAGVAMVITAR
jgi:uncharacterized membrane protein YfcA